MVKEKTSSPVETTTEETVKESDVNLAAIAGQLYLLTVLVQDEKVLATILDSLKDRSTVVKQENLGLKTLAYPINKHRELTMISIFFTASGEAVTAIEKDLKTETDIERFLLTSWKGDIEKTDSPRRPRIKKDEK